MPKNINSCNQVDPVKQAFAQNAVQTAMEMQTHAEGVKHKLIDTRLDNGQSVLLCVDPRHVLEQTFISRAKKDENSCVSMINSISYKRMQPGTFEKYSRKTRHTGSCDDSLALTCGYIPTKGLYAPLNDCVNFDDLWSKSTKLGREYTDEFMHNWMSTENRLSLAKKIIGKCEFFRVPHNKVMILDLYTLVYCQNVTGCAWEDNTSTTTRGLISLPPMFMDDRFISKATIIDITSLVRETNKYWGYLTDGRKILHGSVIGDRYSTVLTELLNARFYCIMCLFQEHNMFNDASSLAIRQTIMKEIKECRLPTNHVSIIPPDCINFTTNNPDFLLPGVFYNILSPHVSLIRNKCYNLNNIISFCNRLIHGL